MREHACVFVRFSYEVTIVPDFSIAADNEIQQWLMDYFDNDITSIRDCANHGHSNGSCGNIYYKESNRFYADYVEAVWQSLSDYAGDIGTDVATFVGEMICEHDVRDHKGFCASLVGTVTQYEASRLVDNLEYHRQKYMDTDDEEGEESE